MVPPTLLAQPTTYLPYPPPLLLRYLPALFLCISSPLNSCIPIKRKERKILSFPCPRHLRSHCLFPFPEPTFPPPLTFHCHLPQNFPSLFIVGRTTYLPYHLQPSLPYHTHPTTPDILSPCIFLSFPPLISSPIPSPPHLLSVVIIIYLVLFFIPSDLAFVIFFIGALR
ncbi:hypothetical protein ASPFODRAFT_487977 [Aspergillus luchuensis CBS 106.47]|uniref:Uncharacterized protein n=1 Tax=Aspergillus luchuensis (strain CBS 106.47) TaxID=1137211 RepID=A0A1M3TRJ4_ASPLC|nr:hypothetical protein ASPFODRAFT_487977 [Aspergillus luchuensis CBS 106.47]